MMNSYRKTVTMSGSTEEVLGFVKLLKISADGGHVCLIEVTRAVVAGDTRTPAETEPVAECESCGAEFFHFVDIDDTPGHMKACGKIVGNSTLEMSGRGLTFTTHINMEAADPFGFVNTFLLRVSEQLRTLTIRVQGNDGRLVVLRRGYYLEPDGSLAA